MKTQLDSLTIMENESFIIDNKKIVKVLKLSDDNYISDAFMSDTLLIGIEDLELTKLGDLVPYDEQLTAIWITRHQAVIIKNHLDSFINLAEDIKELNNKDLK